MLRRAFVNAAAATLGTASAMLAGLLVMPHLIAEMGSARYGLWTLVTGITAYLTLLDFGVTAAVWRLTARIRDSDSVAATNELISTAIVLLTGVCLVLCLATWAAASVFCDLFPVPPDQTRDVILAIWIVGLSTAATIPFGAYVGLVWAYERFDLLNAVEIPAAVLRTVGVLVFVKHSWPLVHVAAINGAVSMLVVLCKTAICYVLAPQLRVRVRYVSRARMQELFSFGFWMNLLVLSRAVVPQIISAFIARLISTSALTTFSVARQLVFYTNTFMNSATQVLAPRAMALGARPDAAPRTTLLLEGGRYALALTLFFFGGFSAFGAQFINIWQHGSQNAAYPLLLILLAGEVLPMSQWVTYSQIVGAQRQKFLAYTSAAEGVLAVGASAVLLPRFGLTAACIGISVVATVIRGIWLWWLGCRLLGVPLSAYLQRVFMPVTALAALPIAAAFFASRWLQIESWRELLAVGAAYALIFAALLGGFLLGRERLRAMASALRQVFA
jgi:O-antigen/teichoic acid export membrane protein